jgi:hypothetical protein
MKITGIIIQKGIIWVIILMMVIIIIIIIIIIQNRLSL